MTTTDAAGREHEVVQTFGPGDEGFDPSAANHTAGFKSQKQRSVEAQGAPGPGLPIVVLALAGIVALGAARRE